MVQISSLPTLYQVYMIKKKDFTCNDNKSVTRVFSCSGPQNLSTRLMSVMLLHSKYWLSSPTPSFTSRRNSILNTVTESFPKIFKFPYLNVVLLISTLSLFGSYLKEKERQLCNCIDNFNQIYFAMNFTITNLFYIYILKMYQPYMP